MFVLYDPVIHSLRTYLKEIIQKKKRVYYKDTQNDALFKSKIL